MHWTERLSEYTDGELTAAEQAACDAHLATCETCRQTLAELRVVIDTAVTDDESRPDTDLWPGILQRIAADRTGTRSGTGKVAAFTAAAQSSRRTPRQYVFTLPQLALAASLLIAVSAGVAYLAGRDISSALTSEDAIQAYAEPLMPASANLERANFADPQFEEAIADLEKMLADLRDELNPHTVMVIERNLATIDEAIREARAALDADPANTFLNSHLADARRKKLDLLRRATMIHSTSGD